MLAAEYETLPSTMQVALRAFFDANEQWLAGVLAIGRKAAVFMFRDSPAQAARTLTAVLEGAMLLARPYQALDRFEP